MGNEENKVIEEMPEMTSHDKWEYKRNQIKEKYKAAIEVVADKNGVPLDDAFEMFITICRGGNYGVCDVKIVDGTPILVYAEGIEVDFNELKNDYAEYKGYSDENAKEKGLN